MKRFLFSIFVIVVMFQLGSCDQPGADDSVVDTEKPELPGNNSNNANGDTNVVETLVLPSHERVTETTMPQFLGQPAANHVEKMKVLVLAYLPPKNGDSTTLDNVRTGINMSMEQIKEKIEKMSVQTKYMLEEGSKFRGYKNPAAIPYMGYEIVDFFWVYDILPQGEYAGYDSHLESHNYFPDYEKIMRTWKGKYYVDTLGVDEVWLWGWHHDGVVPKESNMSSPHRDSYTTTGNVSNSNKKEDMPVYENTYMLYNYNYGRSANQAVHNHLHQMENMLWHVSYLTTEDEVFIRNNFSGWVWDDPIEREKGPLGAVGDCHHPVNTRKDYDYTNKTIVESDIEDWNPNRTGAKKPINCDVWYNYFNEGWPTGYEMTEPTIGTPNLAASVDASTEAAWYIYWMQSIPGFEHHIYYEVDGERKKLTNWMKIKANWDKFLEDDIYLWEEY